MYRDVQCMNLELLTYYDWFYIKLSTLRGLNIFN